MTTIGSAGITFLNTTSQNTSGLINVQSFNSSGTWTKPSGYSANSRVLIQTWGGGGSGGRNGTTILYTGGGGGGGYNERWLLLSQLGATETVTVGAGGAARTTNLAGATGGTSSVGSLINAFGGAGGDSSTSPLGGGGGGQLSAGGTGAINLPGQPYILYNVVAVLSDVDPDPESTIEAVTSITISKHGEGARTGSGSILGYVHGGGGGGIGGSVGANTVYGGAGGGGYASGAAGGTSSFGGNGGAAGSTGTGVAGTQPGGGGGGATATSGAGGAGRVIITVFPNSN